MATYNSFFYCSYTEAQEGVVWSVLEANLYDHKLFKAYPVDCIDKDRRQIGAPIFASKWHLLTEKIEIANKKRAAL